MMFGGGRRKSRLSLLRVYVKTADVTQYRTFKQLVGLLLYLPVCGWKCLESVHRGHLKKTECHEILCSGKYGFKNASAHHVQNTCVECEGVCQGAPLVQTEALRPGPAGRLLESRESGSGVPPLRGWTPVPHRRLRSLSWLRQPGRLGGPWSLARQRELPRPGWVRGGRGLGRCPSRPAETPACAEKWGDRKHVGDDMFAT